MSYYPKYHIGEEVRIGRQVADRRMMGRVCRIEGFLRPIHGERRYAVSTESGLSSIVFESTLYRQLGDWKELEAIWRPNRISR